MRTRILGTAAVPSHTGCRRPATPVPPVGTAVRDVIRTATNLVPPEVEVVRIVDVVGPDTQADDGTRVAFTAMIGGIEVPKLENRGRGLRRVRISIR